MKFASLATDIWELDNGVERNRETPDIFSIPTTEARSSLKPGDLVKMIFRIHFDDHLTHKKVDEVERMWVIVTHVFDNHYLGRLDNDPNCIAQSQSSSLQAGAEIPFRPEHVIAIHDDPLTSGELAKVLQKPSPSPWPHYDT